MKENTQLTKTDLIGTWKLIDFKITKPDGQTKDWGPKSNGVLIYDESGHMSTSINSGADTNVAAKDLDKNILFYAGTYEVTDKNQVHHFVTNASDPKRIGKEMIRNAEITNQKYLRLTADGEYGQANLLWEKA
ncbi:MAG: lipocalin-like domain-containing protein [Gammaproteobacteria bacterium]|jgi:hypothetical protein|nr:lipocalin-like domain-containing protein [Gammaproteobacteria bacterium]